MNKPIPIADLAAVLHAKRDPLKPMVLVRAYFDESGIHAGTPVTAVGGFMATTPKWERIESDWTAELNRFNDDGYPIVSFHAVDCEHGRGEFSGDRGVIGEHCPQRLAKVIEKHRPIALWSAIVHDDWDEVTTPEFQ